MQLYGECDREGGGGQRQKNYEINTFGAGIIEGSLSSTRPPPVPHSDFQVLPAAQSGSKISGTRETGKAELGAAIQALAGAY